MTADSFAPAGHRDKQSIRLPSGQADPGLLAALVGISQSILGVLDANATIVYESPALLTTLGFAPEELVGRNALDLVHASDVPAVQSALAELVPGGPTQHVRFRFAHKTEGYRLLDATAVVHLGADSAPYVVFCCVDISELETATEQKNESEARFLGLIEVAPDPVLLIQDGRVVMANARAKRLFAAQGRAELIGAELADVIHPEEVSDALNRAERLLGGEEFEPVERRMRAPGGAYLWTEAVGSVVRYAGTPAVLSVFRDMSERHAAAEALERANKDLRAANQELSQMADVAAHDLREPLRMITSFLQLVERRNADTLDEQSRADIATALDGVNRLERLLTDFVGFTHAADATGSMRSVSTEALLSDVLVDYAAELHASGARVHFETLPTVRGDADKLAEVFRHLISNAIRYGRPTDPSREHVISVSALWLSGSWQFKISDNGVGIPQQHRQRVFQIFRRLDGNSFHRDNRSTGIGLPTARRIVEHHGGSIWVEQAASGGAQFVFTLPPVRSGHQDRLR